MMKTHTALQHQQALRRWVFTVAVLALSLLLPLSSHAQEALGGVGGILSEINYQQQRTHIRDTMNFNSCLKYKVGVGMHWCRGLFGIKFPSPCIKFTYNEPTNVNETVQEHKARKIKGGFDLIGTIFAGGGAKTEEKKGMLPLHTPEGIYSRQYDEVSVRYVTPIARYLSSGTPMQATKSLTCGLFGLGSMFQNFSNISNLGASQLLNPSQWGSSLRNSLTNIGQSIRNGALGIATGVTNLAESIANLPQLVGERLQGVALGLQNGFSSLARQATTSLDVLRSVGTSVGTQLDGLANGTLQLSRLNLAELTRAGGAMLAAGSALGEIGAVAGDDEMLNASIGLTTGGEATANLAEGARAGTLTDEEARSLAISALASMRYGLAGVASDESSGQQATSGLKVRQFGQSSRDQDPEIDTATALATGKIAPTPLNPYVRWATTPLGGNPSGKATGGLVPIGEMRNGAGQQAYNQTVVKWIEMDTWLGVLHRAAPQFIADAAEHSAGDLCSADYYNKSIEDKLKTLIDALSRTENPAVIVPPSTYLNAQQRQVAPTGQPNAACPLTHAGFISVEGASKVSILNCHAICDESSGEETSQRSCRLVPKKGFGGSCFTNPLSDVVIDEEGRLTGVNLSSSAVDAATGALFPACNGQTPAVVADGKGGSYQVGQHYNQALDHLSRLNAKARQHFLNNFTRHLSQLQNNKSQIAGLISARGGRCDELGNPAGDWAREAELRRPPSNQLAYDLTDYVLPVTGVDTTGVMVDLTSRFHYQQIQIPVDGNGTNLLLLVDDPEGAARGAVSGALARTMGAGFLPEVYRLDKATPGPVGSAIMSGVAPILADNYELATRMCSSKTLMDGVGATDNMNAASLLSNKSLFVGCWGPVFPVTGYSSGPNPEKNRAKQTEIARRIASAFKAIEKPKSNDHNAGEALMNIDKPEKYTGSDFAKALLPIGSARASRHKGSGCYVPGTSDPRMFNPGEKLLPVGEIVGGTLQNLNPLTATAEYGEGNFVETSWKGTRCCVPVFCPTNVRRDY